jgi:hypothetical protein
MSEYCPDNWVIVKIPTKRTEAGYYYKVLAGWSGSYLYGDSWRLNSGITECVREEPYFLFYGSSGSCYKCHEDRYGLRVNNGFVYNDLKDHGVTMVDEDTNWMDVEWQLD